jgi:hypothetical protein
MSGGPASGDRRAIEIRVERSAQLFNSLDPLPYPDRDLAPAAEDFIVSWARDLPAHQPIRIIVHVPADEVSEQLERRLHDAFRNYFRYGEERLRLDLTEMFRTGRVSLAIGLVVLAVCVLIGQVISRYSEGAYLSRVFEEGLIILGWVANWRPIEIFLYSWWPLARRRTLYARLSAAEILLAGYVEPAQP